VDSAGSSRGTTTLADALSRVLVPRAASLRTSSPAHLRECPEVAKPLLYVAIYESVTHTAITS
jgi:hypothetical protein